jgi:hypothetical protein
MRTAEFLGSIFVLFHPDDITGQRLPHTGQGDASPFNASFCQIELGFALRICLPVSLSCVRTEEVTFGRTKRAAPGYAFVWSNALMPLEVSSQVSASFEFPNTHGTLVLSIGVFRLFRA